MSVTIIVTQRDDENVHVDNNDCNDNDVDVLIIGCRAQILPQHVSFACLKKNKKMEKEDEKTNVILVKNYPSSNGEKEKKRVQMLPNADKWTECIGGCIGGAASRRGR